MKPKLKCVLLIDDDPICNFINKKLIEHMQIADEIKITNNGKEALEFIYKYLRDKKRFPDLILLDLKMPMMNGFDFLENFKHISSTTKKTTQLFILSSSGHALDKERVGPKMKNHFLLKPLTEEKVKHIYQACISINSKNYYNQMTE